MTTDAWLGQMLGTAIGTFLAFYGVNTLCRWLDERSRRRDRDARFRWHP